MIDVIKDSILVIEEKWGEITAEARNKDVETKKYNVDFLTEADKTIEKILRNEISKKAPNSSIVGEEFEDDLDGEEGVYYIDPIDGTFNLARGFPEYCVSIGYEEKGEITAAGVYFPQLESKILCEKGGTIKHSGPLFDGGINKGLNPSDKTDLDGCSIGIDIFEHTEDNLSRYRDLLQKNNVVRQPMSGVYSSIMVAYGAFDLCIYSGLHPWDLAPGCLTVTELGGKVTNLEGQNDWESIINSDVVIMSGNKEIHQKALRL